MTSVPGEPATPISAALRAFLAGWQPRQRRTLGMLHALLVRLQSIGNAHPEWEGYDLLTHLLGALHLVIENDRLTGGRTEEQLTRELTGLVALEQPAEDPAVHVAVARAVVDVLTNARDRRLRLRDRYLHAPAGKAEHREQSFRFVREVGAEDVQPTLRPTPEAINLFQNLYEFDPSDRAAAERYRSARMLERQDYDEVLTSVDRRATAVYALRGELEGLMRRIAHNVRDVRYAQEVIPRLDEVLGVVMEQVAAEERFAETVAEHAHHAAPDLLRLQRIQAALGRLVDALSELQTEALGTRRRFEEEQDRQLFTYRRVTINPQAQLLEPLLDRSPAAVMEVLEGPLAAALGPRVPRVLQLGRLVEVATPAVRGPGGGAAHDPFWLGDQREEGGPLTPALLDAVADLLGSLTAPTSLSQLLDAATRRPDDPDVGDGLPWALAVTVATAYGQTAAAGDGDTAIPGLEPTRHTVVAPGADLPPTAPVAGDDLMVVPRHTAQDSPAQR
jgi:hypothetical protein